MEKYQGFWPLPGGVEKYVDTLNNCLRFIGENRPSEDQLVQWLVQKFENVSEGSARGYVRVTLRHSGLVDHDKKGHFLSQDGKRYLDGPNNLVLFGILDDNVLGFRETLEIIRSVAVDMDDLAKELAKKTKMTWETRQQPIWRVGWLRSMGLVFLDGRKLRLTPAGEEALRQPPEHIDTVQPQVPEEEQVSQPVEKKAEGFPTAEEVISNLRRTQHLSGEHEQFENAVAQTFFFLGFSSEHLGAPGDTDVFAVAHMGDESYSIVIDTKTTHGNRIAPGQVNFDTLEDHKVARRAEFKAVVAASFPGGDLFERARKHAVSLIETETLIKLLELHDRSPLNLEDLERLFDPKLSQPVKLEDCPELEAAAEIYERKQRLFGMVLGNLYHLQVNGESTHAADIRWSLSRQFDMEEILESLDLLQRWNMVKKVSGDNWVALSAPRVAARRLKVVMDSF